MGLQDIATYHGLSYLPEDRLFTYGVQLEPGACLSIERRKLSRDAPMKAVLGQLLAESEQLLRGLIDERHQKHVKRGKGSNTISY
jgi:hypothetical protein